MNVNSLLCYQPLGIKKVNAAPFVIVALVHPQTDFQSMEGGLGHLLLH